MKSLLEKLRLQNSPVIINLPKSIEEEFEHSEYTDKFTNQEKSKRTLVFITNLEDYTSFLTSGLVNVEPDSILWFAYPKSTSGIKTDINRDIIRVTGEQYGITTVTAISINHTWSALRFRPIEKVGK